MSRSEERLDYTVGLHNKADPFNEQDWSTMYHRKGKTLNNTGNNEETKAKHP